MGPCRYGILTAMQHRLESCHFANGMYALLMRAILLVQY